MKIGRMSVFERPSHRTPVSKIIFRMKAEETVSKAALTSNLLKWGVFFSLESSSTIALDSSA